MYQPLPDYITIKPSPISGLGLFATKPIKEGTFIGVILIEHYGKIIRTPLGGFGNHSDNPNCAKCKYIGYQPDDGIQWNLFTKRDIEVGEEITWTYTLYNVQNP